MKNTLITLFGISVFAGIGYTIWVYTPLGKHLLSQWLLSRWEKIAARKDTTLDLKKLETELAKLDYKDHELLYRFTLLDSLGKEDKGELTEKIKDRSFGLYKKMWDRKLFKRADLRQLDNHVLPG